MTSAHFQRRAHAQLLVVPDRADQPVVAGLQPHGRGAGTAAVKDRGAAEVAVALEDVQVVGQGAPVVELEPQARPAARAGHGYVTRVEAVLVGLDTEGLAAGQRLGAPRPAIAAAGREHDGQDQRSEHDATHGAADTMPAVTPRPLVLACLGAVAIAGCSQGKVEVPKDQAEAHRGAVLFNTHCSGCHTIAAANTHGSKPEDLLSGGERTNGPNFNTRKESRDDVLFAIRNGGFSGAIMPANVVVGRDADAVADFLSKYSGKGK